MPKATTPKTESRRVTKQCPNCNLLVSPKARYCGTCGADLSGETQQKPTVENSKAETQTSTENQKPQNSLLSAVRDYFI